MIHFFYNSNSHPLLSYYCCISLFFFTYSHLPSFCWSVWLLLFLLIFLASRTLLSLLFLHSWFAVPSLSFLLCDHPVVITLRISRLLLVWHYCLLHILFHLSPCPRYTHLSPHHSLSGRLPLVSHYYLVVLHLLLTSVLFTSTLWTFFSNSSSSSHFFALFVMQFYSL